MVTEFEPDAAGYARLIEQGDKTIRLIDKYNTRKVYRHIYMHTTMASSRYHWYKVVVVLVYWDHFIEGFSSGRIAAGAGDNSQGLGDYKKARGLRYIRTTVKPNPEGYFGQVTAAMLYTYKTLLALVILPQRVVEDLHKTTVRDADNDV